MNDILNLISLPGLEIFRNLWVIFAAAAGVIAIILLLVIVITLRRGRLKKAVSIDLTGVEDLGDKWPEDNYEFITKRIRQVGKKYKSILFASIEALPTTIPVNVAIGLAKSKKQCLLLDVDLVRDSIARAFELDSKKSDLRPKAVRTEFENLWLWPGHNFAQSRQMNVKEIVQKALDRFDFVLINAPSLPGSPDRRQIILAADAAFICTKDASEAAKLAELIKPSECVVIGNIQIPVAS